MTLATGTTAAKPTPRTWVDFKELRSRLRFADVLHIYNVELKVKGDRANGFCPLPSHDGQRRSPSFSANLTKGIWQCFGCGAKGNVLDFATLMEGADPADSQQLREVALKLQERFGLTTGKAESNVESSTRAPAKPKRAARKAKAQNAPKELPRIVNPPLDFALKSLDARHPYLKSRDLAPKTIDTFGLGYCHLGLMDGRIAIPIHDEHGRLVAYAGRIVDDAKIDEQNPKYRFPGERQRNGQLIEFRKSLLLYNAHRLKPPVHELIIVEGFASVWWLWQHGYPNCVALMGSSCSPEQVELILKLTGRQGRVLLFFDGDNAGERCQQDLVERIGPHRAVQWIWLDDKRQPTDCKARELSDYLSGTASGATGAAKSGTSQEQPAVADPVKTSNVEAADPMAADE